MSTPLQPLIDAAQSGDIITLPDGEYDDVDRVMINKSIKLQGTRNAIIHSEIICHQVEFAIKGLTFLMNKVGGPQLTGDPLPFPQKGMITVLNGIFWSDDCSMRTYSPLPAGQQITFSKPAVHLVKTFANICSRSMLSNIDWRNNDAEAIQVTYGSTCNLFDNTPDGQTFGIAYQTAAGLAGISLASSECNLSGAWLYRYGASDVAMRIARNSKSVIGTGRNAGLSNPSNPFQQITVDQSSQKTVSAGSVG